MTKSDVLRRAKETKYDEYYTQLEDIEKEISSHPDYVKYFEGKTVFCNCDDPERSSFYEFFRLHFKQLKLKKLITTHYNQDGSSSYKLERCGEMLGDDPINLITTPLKGNGDFRSDECIELLKESDIVVTNPPFSLFREYIKQLDDYGKKFVILGNPNAIAYKEFFPMIKNGKCYIGYKSPSGGMRFNVTKEREKDIREGKVDATWKEINGNFIVNCPAIRYTNLEIDKVHEPIPLNKNYKGNEKKYPKYYNYDAIDVSDIKSIPKDYYGEMGVPITFMAQYCLDQFEIIGIGTDVPKTKKHVAYKKEGIICYEGDGKRIRTTPYTVSERKIGNSLRIEKNGLPTVAPYNRILIKRKQQNDGC